MRTIINQHAAACDRPIGVPAIAHINLAAEHILVKDHLTESPGKVILYQGRTFKSYRGMGSMGAMVKGSSDRYRQKGAEAGKLVPEGVEGRVPFKGPLSDFVYQLVGGLRAGMGYIGTRTIEGLRRDGTFIRVSAATVRENHPHDIAITQEAPNYSPDVQAGESI